MERAVMNKTTAVIPLDHSKSEQETIKRINAKFDTMIRLTGKKRGLLVYGPPGIGKTYGIQKRLAELGRCGDVVKGDISATVLYQKLWETNHPNFTLMLDDADSVFQRMEPLMLLKAALDTTKKRLISYNKYSPKHKALGIPQRFDYEGQIIVATNMDLNQGSKRYQPHYDAIKSRCLNLDLGIHNIIDKFIRIKWVIKNSNIVPADRQQEMIDLLWEHRDSFEEFSLRTAVHIRELWEDDPDHWEEDMKVTLFKRSAAK